VEKWKAKGRIIHTEQLMSKGGADVQWTMISYNTYKTYGSNMQSMQMQMNTL